MIVAGSSGLLYPQGTTRSQYIEKYAKIAVQQMNQYNIPASIILAQACLESGNGTSRLAVKANNHFGIKCHNWNGKRIYHDDDRKGECFRKYNSAEDSFKDHSEFLSNGRRYQSLFDLKRSDYKAWAHGLKAAGYATNPQYAQLLIDIIEKYELYEYDNLELSRKEARKLKKEQRKIDKKNRIAQEESNGKAESVKAEMGSGVLVETSDLYKYSLDRQIFSVNGVPYIIATGDESYSSLAKEYNLFKKEILKFNDLKNEEKIEPGTIVFIAKKKKKGEKSAYVVQSGESMYIISQKLGIQLLKLYQLNNMEYGREVEAGKILNLQ